ncbi:MAG: alpha/beta hydrolase [Leptolyngbya sp. Prado105]|jgi:pimeloyl-ACP methyl ester carboxylesterase|nr:alpha/beta hydrolase [Leptolyngbya sp. Prado105]
MSEHSPTSPVLPELREHRWSWKGKAMTLAYEVMGEGKPILLLPALSSVSSRGEMRGLAEQLARSYQVYTIDWIGFGDSSRPAVPYTPALYESCLRNFVQEMFPEPVVVIAAGHAAGYVMELAQRQPPWDWAVLVCPTWRGPLPTAMGEHRWAYRILQKLVGLPLIGQVLYFLNTTRGFLAMMYRRHVFADQRNITPELIQQKQKLTKVKRSRFASAAFVTGELDRAKSREDWLSWFQPLPLPVMMVIGENMPAKSRQEVEVLAHFSGVQVYRMPGSLGLHEEYPEQLAAGILAFLEKYRSRRRPRNPQFDL